MTGSFEVLKVFSILFKVLACLMLVLMLTGVVGVLMGRDGSAPFPFPSSHRSQHDLQRFACLPPAVRLRRSDPVAAHHREPDPQGINRN